MRIVPSSTARSAATTLVAATALLSTPSRTQSLLAMIEHYELLEDFDVDKNGRLDDVERARARVAIRERRRARRGTIRGGALPAFEELDGKLPSQAKNHAKYPLFSPFVVRDIFLYFRDDDWYQTLGDFWHTDVDVPATMLVDGAQYRGVGARFRGTSSYLLALRSPRKSINLSIDHTHADARLDGQRTINLQNAFGDASRIREVLYSRICAEYVPTMRTAFARVTINGRYWGLYGMAQQFNTDFLRDAFGSRKGVRWKVLRNSGGVGALRYLGAEPGKYGSYIAKCPAKDEPDARRRLIELCRVLDTTPAGDLATSSLPKLLDIDGALWFLALENVFLDTDGYVRQGYDYRLVEDRHGRFHPIPYDGNEAILPADTSRAAVAMAARRGQIVFGIGTSPLAQAENPQRPLVHRLLAVPEWRARYLAHVRCLAIDWLDWKKLGPVAQQLHDLIDESVRAEAWPDSNYAGFAQSLHRDRGSGRRLVRSLKSIALERREKLLAHPSLAGAWPAITRVEAAATPIAADTTKQRRHAVRVTVKVAAEDLNRGLANVKELLLHYAKRRRDVYESVAMHKGDDGLWRAVTSPQEPGSRLYYYVEARSEAGETRDEDGSRRASARRLRSSFWPRHAEAKAASIRLPSSENATKARLRRKGD